MDAHKAIITSIFNNSTLIEVPFFQRSYVWKEDLWARMIEDMVLLSDKSCHSGVELQTLPGQLVNGLVFFGGYSGHDAFLTPCKNQNF